MAACWDRSAPTRQRCCDPDAARENGAVRCLLNHMLTQRLSVFADLIAVLCKSPQLTPTSQWVQQCVPVPHLNRNG